MSHPLSASKNYLMTGSAPKKQTFFTVRYQTIWKTVRRTAWLAIEHSVAEPFVALYFLNYNLFEVKVKNF